MAENKKSFILYVDQQSTIEALSDEQAGKLIKHIYKYVNDENPVMDDQLLNIAFLPIKQQLKRDLKRWELRQDQRREAGRRSAELRSTKPNEIERPLTSVNDRQQPSTVNGNVNGNVNGTVTVNVNDKKNKYNNTLMSELKSSDSLHEKIAYNFWLLFLENMKKLKINSADLPKAKYSGWVEPVRLMMERDKRTIEELQEIFRYLKDENPRENGFSWASNIRSTGKLREKFEIILKDARIVPSKGKVSTVQNMANIRNNILQKIENGEFN